MSVRHRSAHGGRARVRVTALLLSMIGFASLSGAQIASADPPPSATVTTADEALATGSAVGVTSHTEPGGQLVELRLPAPRIALSGLPSVEQARRSAARIMSSATSGALAIADGVGDPEAGLTISHPDGSLVRTALAGVAGAAFGPDETWVAAVDAAGRLWRIDARTGAANALAAGRYAGSVRFTRSGELLLIEAASIQAPFASVVVRLSPDSGRSVIVDSEDGFVFSASELADGSIAVTAHLFGGGVEVRRVVDGTSTTLAGLDPNAIDPSVNDDGSRIAYAVGPDVYVHDTARGSAKRLGPGAFPRLARDGSSVLVLRDGAGVLLASDGSQIDRFATATVAWANCERRCSR
jgi:hypothetical protein